MAALLSQIRRPEQQVLYLILVIKPARAVTDVKELASRMRWAVSRETARVEDIAYCLLGLFDVNMPLLYGEGKKSFIRLQQEILLQCEDQSLFAWYTKTSDHVATDTLFGLLADCPDRFLASGRFEMFTPMTIGGEPSAVTSKGIQVELFLVPCHDVEGADFRAILACEKLERPTRKAPTILLKRHWGMGDQYSRVLPYRDDWVERDTSLDESGSWERVFVNQQPGSNPGILRIATSKENSLLRFKEVIPLTWEIAETAPHRAWNDGTSSLELPISKVHIGVPIAIFKVKVWLEKDPIYIDVAIGLKVNSQRSCQSWCRITPPASDVTGTQNLSEGMFRLPDVDFASASATDSLRDDTSVLEIVREHHHPSGLDISLHVLRRVSSGTGYQLAGSILGTFPLVISVIRDYDIGSGALRMTHESLFLRLDVVTCYVKFQNVHEDLLTDIISPDQLQALFDDPFGLNWSDSDMTSKIRMRLPNHFNAFETTLKHIRDSLERIRDIFNNQPRHWNSAWTYTTKRLELKMQAPFLMKTFYAKLAIRDVNKESDAYLYNFSKLEEV
ncbi:hypothetical protein B0T21DRAFT_352369 [Apiosordaria backusii]|uniref:DUF8212 domain-containing protein n=1 Tax=Apiosordaria backusii TaxID=314023 RepID=A0AA40DV89_9PEZI|nr:hypothetical protein B0T21DRAFT_352369 [Apiosordaria backusii]